MVALPTVADTVAMEMRRNRTVFLVEDSAPIRSRLVELLGEIDGVSVVGEAGTPEEAVAGILRTQPHCVVLDLQLLDGSGVDVLRAVRAESPEITFVVLTNHPTPQYRRVCMEAGAAFFLDKSTEFGKLKHAVTQCLLTQS
jgi:DNA-binding NarL/FixJ family response regulator